MIRIIIDRVIAETLEANYQQAATEIMQRAVVAPGFISGEALCDLNNPRHRIVLCKWRTLAEWQKWHDSQERKEMMEKLTLMLEKEESITLLESP